jgi:hypothetical protein
MAENSAKNELVMVFVGKRDKRKKDGTTAKADVYSVMKKESADYIGVPADLRKSGITESVSITKGAAAGATYKRPVKGSRGISYTLHYDAPSDGGAAATNKSTKKVAIGFPSGTPAIVVFEFIGKLTKKPLKINTPRGVMHHLEGAG